MNRPKKIGWILLIGSSMLISCKQVKRTPGWEYAPNMYRPLAYDPDQYNPNFRDGKTAQHPPAGTIPMGFTPLSYPNTREGYEQASMSVKNPLPTNQHNLAEGKVLFTTFCAPCHGAQGQGDGLIVQYGYPPPPSYSKGQSSRGGSLKDLNEGKIYHTITYGVNAMGAYASQLSPDERWKIVLYVRQLQRL